MTAMHFVEGLKSVTVSANLKKHLECLCKIHLAHSIITYADGAILSGYAKPKHLMQIEELLYLKIEEIRPQLLNILESFGSLEDDSAMNSVIASTDGKTYEHLYSAAANNPLNSKDTLDGTRAYLKPLALKLTAKM